jgi:hypothetical protein
MIRITTSNKVWSDLTELEADALISCLRVNRIQFIAVYQ